MAKTLNGRPQMTDAQFARFEDIVLNTARTLRQEWATAFFDPRRNIDDECGYPEHTSSITPQQYQDLYDREPIAARAVQVMAKATWQVVPEVYDDEDPEVTTPFESAVANLAKSIRGEQCYYNGDAGNPIWEYLKRADELSGIGSYGVVLLGVDDKADLSSPSGSVSVANEKPVLAKQYEGDETALGTEAQYRGYQSKAISAPVARVEGRKLLQVRVFPESMAQILQFESNPHSPRLGYPVLYAITLNDPASNHTGIGLPTNTIYVHWSRCVHIADNLGSSEVFGVSRMQRILNRLLDLRKIYASDAEAFWKNIIMRVFFETHPQLGGDVDVDKAGLRDMMENMENGLQRWATLMGMSAKTVAPVLADPTPHVLAQIEAICIQLGIPKRIFMGSERGELASSQDDAAWNDEVRFRQNNFVTPRIIVPFIDRLITLGVLPIPPNGYNVYWPDLASQTDAEKAAVAVQKTTALSTYVAGGVESLIPPENFLTTVMGMTDDEANEILGSVAMALESPGIEEPAESEATDQDINGIADTLGLTPEEKEALHGQELSGNVG